MKKIIFICHGNICRSPVASILFNELINEMGLENKYFSYSRAVSYEEEGNDIYPPMKRVLDSHNISYEKHQAHRVTFDELEKADYIFFMDDSNKYYLNRMANFNPKKMKIITEFIGGNEIEDPWYTGRYEVVYQEILIAVKSIIDHLEKETE